MSDGELDRPRRNVSAEGGRMFRVYDEIYEIFSPILVLD
jgi:hypothetical protein